MNICANFHPDENNRALLQEIISGEDRKLGFKNNFFRVQHYSYSFWMQRNSEYDSFSGTPAFVFRVLSVLSQHENGLSFLDSIEIAK